MLTIINIICNILVIAVPVGLVILLGVGILSVYCQLSGINKIKKGD